MLSSLKEEIKYLRNENINMTYIIKTLTEKQNNSITTSATLDFTYKPNFNNVAINSEIQNVQTNSKTSSNKTKYKNNQV